MVTVTADISDEEALAFSQFLKRSGYLDFRDKAVSPDEARDMQSAGDKVRKALAEAGYSPR